MGRKLAIYEVEEKGKAELEAKKEEIVDLIEYVSFFMRRLDKIAKNLEPNSEANFVAISDVMAKCITAIVPFELNERSFGYQDRVRRLKNLCFKIGEINKGMRFTIPRFLLYSEDDSNLSSSNSSLYGDSSDSVNEDPGEEDEEEQTDNEREEIDVDGADTSGSEIE